MSPRLRASLALTTLFLISVAVRWPLLNLPLGSHDEWLTSTVLRTMEIWEMEGAWKTYKFLPIMTYPGRANYHIDNQAGLEDPSGRQYYVSYPPLAYLVPYVVLQAFGTHIDVLPLQIFSLFLHYLCAWFIYLTVSLLVRQKYPEYGGLCGIIAASIYIFSPATLRYHSSIYMSEMFVQPLFVLGIYFYLKIQLSKTMPVALLAGLGVVTLLMVWTEWLGVLFAFAVFLHGAYRWRNPKMRWMMLAVIVGSVLAYILTFAHYSQIDGLTAFLNRLRTKFLERSAVSDQWTSRLWLKDWGRVIRHYQQGYFPGTLVFVGVMALLALILNFISSRERRINPLLKPVIYVATLPVILHHLILFNYTFHHDFSVLKTAVLLAILAGLFSGLVFDELVRLKSPRWGQARIVLIFCFLGLVCWANITGFYRTKEQRDVADFRDSGWTIRKLAQPDEVIFVVVDDPLGAWPQLVWYAKRNLAFWTNEKLALQLMALNNTDKAIVFTMTPDIRITNVQRLRRQGDALVAQNSIGQGSER